MIKEMVVSITPAAAATAIAAEITQVKTTGRFLKPKRGRLLDDYRVETDVGTFICQVFAMYFARIGSFVTLVVITTDILGPTIIHVTTGGHKRNAIPDTKSDFDFGASASFISMVEHALKGHIVSSNSTPPRHSL